MNRIRKVMTTLGCISLMALLIAAFAPKAVHGVAAALVQVVNTVMTQDVDQPARAPFQVTVPININSFSFTPVTIPSGQRLVVDFVSLSGAAETSGSYVQPIMVLSSTVGGNNSNYYFAPTQSTTVPGQYYSNTQTIIYADSLSVSPAFAGYTPSFMAFNVVISGHLISNP